MTKLLTTLCFTAALVASGSAATIYDANQAFVGAVSDSSYTSTFGAFSVGYILPGESFTAFSDAQKTNGFPTGSNTDVVQGFRVPNSAIVPAAVVNTTDGTIQLSFGANLKGNEILLHPGGLGGDSFQAPIADAVLRFTAPTAGYYSLTGVFSRIHDGTTKVSVVSGGTTLFSSFNYTGVNFNGKGINLAAGETIDFVVNDFDGIGSDSTGLYAKIAMPDNGSTVMLLGLAFVGMAAAVHFRRGAVTA